MESKLMLLCGLMLIFCVTAISAELVAYPHVGCFTRRSTLRYFNRKLPLRLSQEGEDDVMRCFEAARDGNYHIFALRKPLKKSVQCWTGRDAEENLETYQGAYGCRNGLGGHNSFDIYLVPDDPCKDSTCLNGGTCMVSQEEDSLFKCTCKAGFTGTRCEVEVKPCSLHPCKNGGTCQELGDSTYECNCKLGYEGQNCTEKTADFKSSEILCHNEGLLTILLEYLKDEETNGTHWERCFNARYHSYSGVAFHTLCDNKGPTVTLVQFRRYVFGGYTDKAWNSIHSHRSSTRSFLFSLRSSTNASFKSPLFQNYNYATLYWEGVGPVFGKHGSDLSLSDKCHANWNSYSELGGSYELPSGYTITALTGSGHFYCDNYEVFYLA